MRLNIPHLTVNDTVLEVKDVVKDLGVIVDCNLSFKCQINQMVRAAGYHLRNIAFVRKYLDENITKMLVHNYVISKLDYCNCLYYGLPNYLLRKLQLVMNRATRLSSRERVTPILIDLHWLPIKARLVYKICVMAYQALNSGRPKYIRDLLEDFHIDSDMLLRHSVMPHRLHEPRYNLEIGFRAFENCAPRLYNKLPLNLKMAENVEIFKKRLKTYLFTECYDLDDMTMNQEYKC
ncbi:uncharacterized protein LOC143019719 [Oratosquilla oratoria]|uniref:uncharacterized protein LOC143019719 n=1 Tax=Oratosquilla oratoria TaxID=337810 RepID=UPI003F76FBA5